MQRVLTVDDHEENLYLLQVLLESKGYSVQQARNGAEALELARRDPPDLIVSDILMPVMDGFTLCQNWRADERLAPIPFVFYTATYTDARDEQLALNVGADAFITKPAEPETFMSAILAVLARADAGRLGKRPESVDEDDAVLKQYNEALIRKLEQKMAQLEREAVDRRQAEEALRLIQYSVDHVADLVFCTDSAGRLAYANESTGRTLGYERDELLALTLFDLDPTLTEEQWSRAWERMRTEGSYSFETVHRTRLGTSIPVEVSVNYVKFQDMELNFQFARDITDRLRAEAVLRRQLLLDEIVGDLLSRVAGALANELDGIIAAALEPIADFMGVGSIIVFQASEDLRAWSSTFNWSVRGVRSVAGSLKNIPMGSLPWVEGELLAGRTVILPSINDLPPEARKLRTMWVERDLRSALMVPLLGRGKVVRGCLALFAVSHDIPWDQSVVRQAEQVADALASALEHKYVEESLRASDERLRQAQKMEAIGQLAGGIAHDFNNLLTAIIGYSDLIAVSLDTDHRPDDLKRDIEQIRTAAQRAAQLTGQILAFSRRQALRPQVVSLNDLVDEVRPLLQRTLGENIEISFELQPELGRCEVDPHQLVSALMNLAVNARDAMPDGGRLTIATNEVTLDEEYCAVHDDCRPGEYVGLTVSDTGVGIDREVLPRIFEPFFTTKDPGRGTGLGLSTVHGVVKQSGGSVSVRSEPGRGTSFEIYLPRSQKPVQPTATVPAPRPGAVGGETILVVEDEEALRALLKLALESAHYSVLLAQDGPEALKLLGSATPIDLLLTDLVLPGGVQGTDVCQKARALRPGLAVIQMSGYSHNTAIQADAFGGDIDYLEKPFTTDALKQKIRQALDARPPMSVA